MKSEYRLVERELVNGNRTYMIESRYLPWGAWHYVTHYRNKEQGLTDLEGLRGLEVKRETVVG